MKIINLEKFRAMPSGTVFSKYAPCYFEEPRVKAETWETDFCYTNLVDGIECEGESDFEAILYRAEELGERFGMDFETISRDGCFKDDQLFAVWEEVDLRGLIAKLEECLNAWKR